MILIIGTCETDLSDNSCGAFMPGLKAVGR
jgi:hypothetical protein